MGKRLPHKQVLAIREHAAEGYEVWEIAQRFTLHRNTISRILNGHTYQRVTPTELTPPPQPTKEHTPGGTGTGAHQAYSQVRARPLDTAPFLEPFTTGHTSAFAWHPTNRGTCRRSPAKSPRRPHNLPRHALRHSRHARLRSW